MTERQAPFIPLWEAAAVAFERLFPQEDERDARLLDVIALALSALIPIYTRNIESGALRELTDAEMEDGRHALVSLQQLERALKTIDLGSLDAARVSLTLRQSRRPDRSLRP